MLLPLSTKISNAATRTPPHNARINMSFVPMVVEAVGGGWGKVARGVWSELAKISALAIGDLETERTSAVMLRQRLSMTLRRENARACLRRIVH